jgi:hypothetical protein
MTVPFLILCTQKDGSMEGIEDLVSTLDMDCVCDRVSNCLPSTDRSMSTKQR